jgi:hypothetical protein
MESKLDMLTEPVREILAQVGAFVPRLALAIFLIFVGWLAAKAVRFAVQSMLRAVNVNVLGERSGIDAFLQHSGVRADMVGIFGWIGYWSVIIATLMIAFNAMGLMHVTDLLRQIVLFTPHVIIGLIILLCGAYLARVVSDGVMAYWQQVELQDARIVSTFVRTAVIVFAALIALDQVGVGGTIVRESFLIILAGVVFGLALAFGLAGKDWAARLLERWSLSRARKDPYSLAGTNPMQRRRAGDQSNVSGQTISGLGRER